ncbi:UNVERIFIED_CONTAM: hypothetical protein HDU68_011325 [Siphonaria sp. JEL0065]|nr:hypothetical protein HDU68_011325 [Siphonaria sp. JEL0065]
MGSKRKSPDKTLQATRSTRVAKKAQETPPEQAPILVTVDSDSDFESIAKRTKPTPTRKTFPDQTSLSHLDHQTSNQGLPALPVLADLVPSVSTVSAGALSCPDLDLDFSDCEVIDLTGSQIKSAILVASASLPDGPAATSTTGKRTPTAEQQAIIDFGASLPIHRLGNVCRIVAGAGTGKTTTLQLLAETLVKQKHRVLYIVYNKTAQADAEERFKSMGAMVTCRTMHGTALQYMQRPNSNNDFPINPVDDHDVMKRIERDYERTVERWLASNFRGTQPRPGTPEHGKAVAARIKTVCFFIFKTLEFWYRRADPVQKLLEPWTTYYPAKKKHTEEYRFEPGRFYVDIANEIWTKMWNGHFPITHDAYLKYAQLGNFRLPPYITTVLMDESQDSSACQLDLFITQLAKNSKGTQSTRRNVFIVGDAAQSIYYFRGARPKELAQIQTHFDAATPLRDFTLTKSFRFGHTVAKVANTLLWMKANSPQAKDFNPYCLVGGSGIPGKLIGANEHLPYPYTIIARSGLKLIMKGLEAVAIHDRRKTNDEPLKIAINGNPQEYKTKMKDALDVYRLFTKQKPIHPKFSEWETFQEFEKDVADREMGEYNLMISLIETYQERTPDVIREFEESILEKKFMVAEADVVLTTAHQSKGLEYDHVEVCDDFIDLDVTEKKPENEGRGSKFVKGSQAPKKGANKKEMEFKLNAWGDDLNLWYVAVTRPKKLLKLPDKWWGIMEFMKKVKDGKAELFLNGKEQLKPEDAAAMKRLFASLNPYLKGKF